MTDREDIIRASRIAAEALHFGRGLIKRGVLAREIADRVEEKISELGGRPAFPAQLSLNHIAAHQCPDYGDNTTLSDQLVKLDVGVEINGFIGDNACTVDLSGENSSLVKASEEALKAAIGVVGTGVAVSEIGRAIKEAIESHGFTPIVNLSGHGLGRYNVHDKPSIPNFDNGDKTLLKEGAFIAIEPFATNGRGSVTEASSATVFSFIEDKPIRDSTTRAVLAEIIKNYSRLPFASRWLTKAFKPFEVKFALRQLEAAGAIKGYPPLGEQSNGLVSQAEHTILVSSPSEVLTLI